MTPLVNYGGTVSAYAAKYPSLTWAGAHPAVVADAQKYSTQLTFAATHPTVVAAAQKYSVQLANAQKFAPELAVIQKNPALFAQAARYPSAAKIPPALTAKLIAAAGGGTKGIQVLTTINANKAAITGVIAVAPALQQIATVRDAADGPGSGAAFGDRRGLGSRRCRRTGSPLQGAAGSRPPTCRRTRAAVVAAAANSPGQWKTWYWICVAGIIVFLLSIPLLRGRWRPSDARRDEEEHEAMVQAELAKLGSAT